MHIHTFMIHCWSENIHPLILYYLKLVFITSVMTYCQGLKRKKIFTVPIIVDSHKLFLVHSLKYYNFCLMSDIHSQCLHFVLWYSIQIQQSSVILKNSFLTHTLSRLPARITESSHVKTVLVEHGDTFKVHWEEMLAACSVSLWKRGRKKPLSTYRTPWSWIPPNTWVVDKEITILVFFSFNTASNNMPVRGYKTPVMEMKDSFISKAWINTWLESSLYHVEII